MGSFSVTDLISGSTIMPGQKTSIQLLVPSYGYNSGFKKFKNIVVCDNMSQIFFSPFVFPIHGVYNDYGFINNIQRNHNVELLEKHFEMSIESIFETVVNKSIYEQKDDDSLINKLHMTYFRTEILDIVYDGYNKYNLINPKKYTQSNEVKNILADVLNRKSSKEIKKRINEIENLSEENITDKIINEFIELIREENRINLKTYIDTSPEYDMYRIFNFSNKFKDDIIKQYHLVNAFSNELNIMFKPSLYGGQESNMIYKYDFNKRVNDVLMSDIEENYSHDEKILFKIKSYKRNKKIDELL